jgi:dolichol kinase
MAALAQASGQEAVPAMGALVGIALAAVLVEQLAFAGLDNLTVPLSVGWLWIWAANGG